MMREIPTLQKVCETKKYKKTTGERSIDQTR